jgi:hypothetical protein
MTQAYEYYQGLRDSGKGELKSLSKLDGKALLKLARTKINDLKPEDLNRIEELLSICVILYRASRAKTV